MGTSLTPIVVVYATKWCDPCARLISILFEIKRKLSYRIIICRIDIESVPDIPSQLGVKSIPTMGIFADGKMLSLKEGIDSKEAILDWINNTLK